MGQKLNGRERLTAGQETKEAKRSPSERQQTRRQEPLNSRREKLQNGSENVLPSCQRFICQRVGGKWKVLSTKSSLNLDF